MAHLARRTLLTGPVALLMASRSAMAHDRIRLGMTPVFLDNDAEVTSQLRDALGVGTGLEIELVQRRTYDEVTDLLLKGRVDAAWLCGFSFLQHEAALSLLGVPLWHGTPFYRSYLIVGAQDPATGLADLQGGSHAFSDPDSNSGWLVTVSDLARLGQRPETFFQRSLFADGHRNVVRFVAGGLTRSGSVDGYVWEALAKVEPVLTSRTKVIAKSEEMGFPPFVTRRDRVQEPSVKALQSALHGLGMTRAGMMALARLQLDGVIAGDTALFDSIRQRMRDVDRL